jgi:hypothetical protein
LNSGPGERQHWPRRPKCKPKGHPYRWKGSNHLPANWTQAR